LHGAQALAEYSDGYYQGTPAATINRYGAGLAVYQACRDSGSLKAQILDDLLQQLDITGNVANLPHGVTAHSRTDGTHTYLFLENYLDTPAAGIDLGRPVTDMVTGETLNTCNLGPYGIRIFKAPFSGNC
jgi:beta-galactosidase